MTLKEIYLMTRKSLEQEDPIPACILADMLEDAGIDPNQLQDFRMEGVTWKHPYFRTMKILQQLDLSWSRTFSGDELFKPIVVGCNPGDDACEAFSITLYRPLRDMTE